MIELFTKSEGNEVAREVVHWLIKFITTFQIKFGESVGKVVDGFIKTKRF